MFGLGKLLGTAVKIATLPIDVAEVGLDIAIGGDGSKKELRGADLPTLGEARDAVVDVIETIDE